MKRYAELIGNYKNQRIKSLWDNKLVIDADYRGECIVALHNDSDICQKIVPNERIGQMILLPFISMDFIEVDELSDTVRGVGGFGSTGLTKE